MSQPIRAVYMEGQLRLLDRVDLVDGQEVQLLILSDVERVHAALGGLLVEDSESARESEALDEDALMREIESAFQGLTSLSDTLIRERREGR